MCRFKSIKPSCARCWRSTLFLLLGFLLRFSLFHHLSHFLLKTILFFRLLFGLLNLRVDFILIDDEILDDQHNPKLGAGPVIKINRNQRYATNSEGAARLRLVAERAGVTVQSFVMRSDLACGSTIGPITAAETGIATTDIGVPTLGMHSVRELACAADVPQMISLIEAFYRRLA